MPTHYVCTHPRLGPQSALSIPRLGIEETLPPRIINRPAGNDTWLFMHFHTRAVIQQGTHTRELAPDTFIIWEPGRPQVYGHPTQSWSHTWAHFGGPLAQSRIQAAPADIRGIALARMAPDLARRYVGGIYEEIHTHRRPSPRLLANLLENWLVELVRERELPDSRDVPREFFAIKTLLDREFTRPVTLEELSQRACLSVSRFCARFKALFGMSAIAYLTRVRMDHAAFMLRDVNLQVRQVAQRVGYEDICYFSKVFKRHFGKSPRAFRERLRREQG